MSITTRPGRLLRTFRGDFFYTIKTGYLCYVGSFLYSIRPSIYNALNILLIISRALGLCRYNFSLFGFRPGLSGIIIHFSSRILITGPFGFRISEYFFVTWINIFCSALSLYTVILFSAILFFRS